MKVARPSLLPLLVAALVSVPDAAAQTPIGGPTPAGERHPPRVWVVDAAGGGDFADIQPAVDAAGNGDVVVVRDAVALYGSFTVARRGLTIVGEGVQRPTIEGTVTVRRLPAGAELVLRGLEIGAFAGDGAIVTLRNNAGIVWIEDCVVDPNSASSGPGVDGLRIVDSDSVALLRVEVTQPSGQVTGSTDPRRGLFVVRSSVHAYASTFRGPNGSYTGFGAPAQTGGTAARLEDSFLFASDCTFLGGAGTPSECQAGDCAIAGAPGGDGLSFDATSVVRWLDGSANGGAGAAATDCGLAWCAGQPDGNAFVAGGLFDDLAKTARGYALSPGLVAAGQPAMLTATGEPADLVYTLSSVEAHAQYSSLLSGTELVQPPFSGPTFAGSIPGNGMLEASFALPAAVGLLGHARVFAQGFVFGGGDAFMAGASVVVVVPQLPQ